MTDTGTDARLDPWCVVWLVDGTEILFGYATYHAATGGLSWMHSSPIRDLDETLGRATTASGRRYALGCRVEPQDLPLEGEEAWIAYDLLLGADVADPEAVPPISADRDNDTEWVAASKIARHLGVVPPTRAPVKVRAFLDKQLAAYVERRALGRRQQCRIRIERRTTPHRDMDDRDPVTRGRHPSPDSSSQEGD